MKRTLVLSLGVAGLLIIPAFAAGPAASAPIGFAMGLGVFDVNDAPVSGPVDLANGARLHTTVSPADIQLENGVVIRLATRSRTMLFGDRVVLENGALRMNHFDRYAVQAAGLTIQTEGFDTEAIVRTTPKTIEIAAIGGTVRVSDTGSAMTLVAAGTKMAFQNTGAAASGQNPQTPAQTGAAPAQTQPQNGPFSDKKAILWAAGICAVGAIVVGSLAAAEGKSPF